MVLGRATQLLIVLLDFLTVSALILLVHVSNFEMSFIAKDNFLTFCLRPNYQTYDVLYIRLFLTLFHADSIF